MITPDGFIATVTLDSIVGGSNVKFIRWQVHDDWVGQVGFMVLFIKCLDM